MRTILLFTILVFTSPFALGQELNRISQDIEFQFIASDKKLLTTGDTISINSLGKLSFNNISCIVKSGPVKYTPTRYKISLAGMDNKIKAIFEGSNTNKIDLGKFAALANDYDCILIEITEIERAADKRKIKLYKELLQDRKIKDKLGPFILHVRKQ